MQRFSERLATVGLTLNNFSVVKNTTLPWLNEIKSHVTDLNFISIQIWRWLCCCIKLKLKLKFDFLEKKCENYRVVGGGWSWQWPPFIGWKPTLCACLRVSVSGILLAHLLSALTSATPLSSHIWFFFFQKITEQSDDYGVRQDPQSFDFWHFPPANLSLKRSRFSRRIKRLWVAWIGRNAHIRKVKFRRQAGAKKKWNQPAS